MTAPEIDFSDIGYLKNGTTVQQEVYVLLKDGGIMALLSAYEPVVAGTIPLDINIPGSDIDILCQYKNAGIFRQDMLSFFGAETGFAMQEITVHDKLSIVVNFAKGGYDFEIFAQDIPAVKQMGYRHMLIEHKLLLEYGQPLKDEVIRLKKLGYKTEPAFCIYLDIKGNPYLELLKLE